jgi:hypothetical protein
LDRDRLDFFVNLESFFEASAAINPTLSYEGGVTIRIIDGNFPVSFRISFNGVSYLGGDTFTTDSFKGYVVSGFILDITKHWQMAVQGRVAVVDGLNLKPNISFNDLATGLFEDVKGNFALNLGYQF